MTDPDPQHQDPSARVAGDWRVDGGSTLTWVTKGSSFRLTPEALAGALIAERSVGPIDPQVSEDAYAAVISMVELVKLLDQAALTNSLTRSRERVVLREENDRLRLDSERLRMLAETVGDPELLDHWAECPLPPDAGCDRCKRWFSARHQMVQAGEGSPQERDR